AEITCPLSHVICSYCNGTQQRDEDFCCGQVGNTPIQATFTAKFDHTPAFVFFVVANAMVSFHNLLMIALQIFGGKMEFTGFRLLSVAILDMLNVTLISAAANAAAVHGGGRKEREQTREMGQNL
ncbi:Casparian strip membrane protein, partial [Arabidopsis thaliana x Arabidopsis arenosa]